MDMSLRIKYILKYIMMNRKPLHRKKNQWPFLLLFPTALLLLLAPEPGAALDSSWQKVDEGFEVRSMEINGNPYQTFIRLKVLRIDPEKFQIRVLDSRLLGIRPLTIRDMAKQTQALAAINGGFFQPDYRPLGLLIVDGRETNPLRKTDWGVFLLQDNRLRIIHTTEFKREGNITQALQVGPRLVVNGRELQLKKQVARRSALGVTFKNQLIMVNTEDSDVYAQDLARIFHLPESEGGLDCQDALTLDGGPSAQMYVKFKTLKIDIPGGWPVPNGVGVFRRQM